MNSAIRHGTTRMKGTTVRGWFVGSVVGTLVMLGISATADPNWWAAGIAGGLIGGFVALVWES